MFPRFTKQNEQQTNKYLSPRMINKSTDNSVNLTANYCLARTAIKAPFTRAKKSARHLGISARCPNYFGTALPFYTRIFSQMSTVPIFVLAPLKFIYNFPGKMAANDVLVAVYQLLSRNRRLEQEKAGHQRFRKKRQQHLKAIREIKRRGQKKRWIFVAMMQAVVRSFRERRLWMRPSNQMWFDIADTQFDDHQWYENFRISRDTLQFILNEIEGDIMRRDTTMR